MKYASPPLRISVSSLFTSSLAKCKLFPALCVCCLMAYFQTEVKGGQIGLTQQSLVPFALIVMPFSNGFRRRTLCPSEEIQQIVRLFEQRWSYPSSV